MKRFAMAQAQMNTCTSTDASSTASAACHAASAHVFCMDTAILAVSIFYTILVSIFGIISVIGIMLLAVSILLAVVILVWNTNNSILPLGRIHRTGKTNT